MPYTTPTFVRNARKFTLHPEVLKRGGSMFRSRVQQRIDSPLTPNPADDDVWYDCRTADPGNQAAVVFLVNELGLPFAMYVARPDRLVGEAAEIYNNDFVPDGPCVGVRGLLPDGHRSAYQFYASPLILNGFGSQGSRGLSNYIIKELGPQKNWGSFMASMAIAGIKTKTKSEMRHTDAGIRQVTALETLTWDNAETIRTGFYKETPVHDGYLGRGPLLEPGVDYQRHHVGYIMTPLQAAEFVGTVRQWGEVRGNDLNRFLGDCTNELRHAARNPQAKRAVQILADGCRLGSRRADDGEILCGRHMSTGPDPVMGHTLTGHETSPWGGMSRATIMNVFKSRRATGEAIAALVREYRDGGLCDSDKRDLLEHIKEAAALGRINRTPETFVNELGWRTRNNGLSELIDTYLEIASHCGHMIVQGEHHEVYDNRTGRHVAVCDDCYEDSDVVVEVQDDSSTLYLRDYVYQHDDGYYYTYEEESNDDDDDEPSTSYHNADGLMCYSTDVMKFLTKTPDHTVTTVSEPLMGLELEMELPGNPNKYIPDMREQLGQNYAVFKADGSLSDARGAELVTAPRLLAEHIEKLGKWSAPRGTTSWDSGRCGLHVHLDSRAFTPMTLGKFVQFINADANAGLIRNIAGRHPSRDPQAESYCRQIGREYTVNPALAKDGTMPQRYRMVNLTTLNYHEARRLNMDTSLFDYEGGRGGASTVELRIFRGSLRKERLLAQIEFANAALYFCRDSSYRLLNEEGFKAWLSTHQHRWPNLAKWFQVRTVRPTAQRPAPATVETTTETVEV